MAKSGKSKDELEQENALLKEKLKELLSLAKSKEEFSGLECTALGVVKIDGLYKIAELKYNPITKQAQVIDVRDAAKNNKDFSLALYSAKEFLVTKILEETKKQ